MERLTQRDFRAVLEFLLRSYAVCDFPRFSAHVVSTLPLVVPSDITTYNEVHPRKNRVTMVTDPPGALDFPDSLRIFERHMGDHPLIARHQRTGDGRAFKISDFLTRSRFHRLALYNEYYRRVDVEHQIAFTLPAPPGLVIGIALNRGRRDFSERERLVLNVLRPHLIQAYRNAEVVTEMRHSLASLDTAMAFIGRGVVVLTAKGRIRLMTERARELTARYFGSVPHRSDRLPDPLQRWLTHQQQFLNGVTDSHPAPREPLTVDLEGRQLVVRLFFDTIQSYLLLEERQTGFQPSSLEALGLSRREAEVLAWVAGGKTNEEIARILTIALSTVKKHLENIFIKLGVENRVSAMMKAREGSPE